MLDSKNEWEEEDESAEDDEEDVVYPAESAPAPNSSICAKLYNSGCSQHLSSYCDEFQTYKEIQPKQFMTMNKQDFKAVGQEDIIINVPDGTDTLKIHLTKVLYFSEISYTIVSVGYLDQAGYALIFGQGKCHIEDLDGNHVGAIPCSQKSLYCVLCESGDKGVVNLASPIKLSETELHQFLGYMSLIATEWLVTHDFVTSLWLEKTPSGNSFFCEACIYAKTKCQSIPKVWKGSRASTFGQEVHSNVWGPLHIKMISGWRYFVTFIDNYSYLTCFYFLCNKLDTFASYKKFEAWVKNHAKANIGSIHFVID